ncbi:MAG: hybrid sensor histidine kinase/response regulator [Planctomycetales bacterium]|nr:hybrid sensor histidine kinase/response regulator [Planctomycetales bacterium]
MSSSAGLPDQFLVDLFREEVRTNVRTLNEGLVGIEQNPDDTGLIEPLMRSAHSIKGASRVVNIDEGVRLAHVMEELLVAAQNAKLRLTSVHVDLLLRGVDLLGQIGEAVGPSFADWQAARAAEVEELIRQLEAASSGKRVEATQSSEAGVGVEERDPPVGAVGLVPRPTLQVPAAPRKKSKTKPNAAADSQSEQSSPTEVSSAERSTADLANSPLLDLFRGEARTQVDALRAGLVELERDPTESECLARLVNAARSAKSASHVVGVREAARLTQAIESCLQAALDGLLELEKKSIADLNSAVGLVADIAQSVGRGYEAWLDQHLPAVSQVVSELEARKQPENGVVMTSESSRTRETSDRSLTTLAAKAVAKPSPTRSRSTSTIPPVRVTSTAARPDKSVATKSATVPAASAGDSVESVVRVTAQSLTRLMGLAGESLVEARWLPVFTNSLVRLKKQQTQVSDLLDGINESLPDTEAATQIRILINDARQRLKSCQTELGGRIGEFENHARQSDDLNSRLYHEVIASRMRPLADGVHGFPRRVRDLSRQLGKQVVFEILGQATPVDRDILEKLEAPLTHILRNAIDHGMETPAERTTAGKPEGGRLRLAARHSAGMLSITITDDGRGIDTSRLRLNVVERGLTNPETASRLSEQELLEFLFLPGFSTREDVTDVSGRGVGLDVVRSMVQTVGGTVRIQTQLGRGTTFHLQLPITLSVIRVVLVRIANEPYAFPHNRIDRLFQLPRESVASLEHRQFCNVDGSNVGLVVGRQVFPLPDESVASHSTVERVYRSDTKGHPHDDLNVVLFSNHTDQFGLVVDAFLGEQDLVVRTLDPRLGHVPNIQAAAILDDGSPILIVDLDDLRTSIERLLKSGKLQRTDQMTASTMDTGPRRILVVDDSITVREVQRQLLTGRGYSVEVAVDGLEGWNRVREEKFDLVISDIDMPRMDGFEFVRSMKIDPLLQSTPVIIVSYKDREDDRQRGLEVGANYYLTKSSFHDESLLSAVEDLIGGPEG